VRVYLLAAAVLLVAVPRAHARAGPGSTTANFLKIGVGPRPSALGGAFVGLADDVNAIYYNPGGLGMLQRQEMTFMHHSLYEGVRQEWGAYALPTRKLGTFAMSFDQVSVSPFPAYDESDIPMGSVDSSERAFTLGYGYEFGTSRWLSLGVAAKYISSRLWTYTASAGAVDAGMIWRFGREVEYDTEYRFGAAIRNIGPGMKYVSESFNLPQSLNLGISRNGPLPHPFEDMRMVAMLEAVVPNDDLPFVAVGIETKLVREFAVRLGYRQNQDTGLGITAGIGFTSLSRGFTAEWWPEISIDYSFVDYGKLDMSHRIGFSLAFGDNKLGETTPPSLFDTFNK